MPPSLIEKAQKLAAKTIKAAEEAKAKSLRARSTESAERKLKREIERKTGEVMGKSIVQLHKAGRLTPQHLRNLNEILQLVGDKPPDWYLLKDYLLPVSVTRHQAERAAE